MSYTKFVDVSDRTFLALAAEYAAQKGTTIEHAAECIASDAVELKWVFEARKLGLRNGIRETQHMADVRQIIARIKKTLSAVQYAFSNAGVNGIVSPVYCELADKFFDWLAFSDAPKAKSATVNVKKVAAGVAALDVFAALAAMEQTERDALVANLSVEAEKDTELETAAK